MKDKIQGIIKYLIDSQADYADIRYGDSIVEKITTENQDIRDISLDLSRGVGIRVFYNGALGFASTNDMNKLKETAGLALDKAIAGSELQKQGIELPPREPVQAHYETPFKIDPLLVPREDKVKLLFEAEGAMKEVSENIETAGYLECHREDKIYADTEGSIITQRLYKCGGGIEATARGRDIQTRSYPNSFGGNFESAGYEYILALDLIKNAPGIAREAVMLADAEECPSGIWDMIIDGSQLAIQIHESIGHAVELDRILGYEAAMAGTSFVKADYINSDFIYASPHVTVTADATITGGLGTFGFDDEGTRAARNMLIERGALKDLLSSRDTSFKIKKVSNGCSRADGWGNLPIVRMTNISLEPGDYGFEELVSGISKGLFICTNKSWSIDDKRINFQFGCEIAHEILDGKLTGKVYKNPVYSGNSLQFWKSCDGICSRDHWRLHSVPDCIKGQPVQNVYISHGASPARFRNIKAGVK